MKQHIAPAATGVCWFPQRDSKNNRLMGTIDQVNAKYGRGTVKTAAEGVRQDWQMRRELMSPGIE